MSKMLIVSSYSESCGNAAFTKVLHDTIEEYGGTTVDVAELDLPMLQSMVGWARAAADEHIAQMCQELSRADAVNIQVEAGLYGTLPKDILRRLRKLMRANKNTSLTLHSPRILGSASQGRAAIAMLLRFQLKGAIKLLTDEYKRSVHINLNRKIVKEAVTLGLPLIVHTLRAKKQIASLFHYNNVHVHPLRIVPENFDENRLTLERIKERLGIAPQSHIVGLFGYISANKGHLDALAALALLPKEYKLIIFGRQHPQTIKSDGRRDEYLSKIISAIKKHRVEDRVFFLGELSDAEFAEVAAAVDVSWLPYYENGQDGSGIASITMDVSKRVIASTSFAFDELQKLIPYRNVTRFDIGNEYELATKTIMAMKSDPGQRPYGDESVYSMRTQAEVYLNVAGIDQKRSSGDARMAAE